MLREGVLSSWRLHISRHQGDFQRSLSIPAGFYFQDLTQADPNLHQSFRLCLLSAVGITSIGRHTCLQSKNIPKLCLENERSYNYQNIMKKTNRAQGLTPPGFRESEEVTAPQTTRSPTYEWVTHGTERRNLRAPGGNDRQVWGLRDLLSDSSSSTPTAKLHIPELNAGDASLTTKEARLT